MYKAATSDNINQINAIMILLFFATFIFSSTETSKSSSHNESIASLKSKVKYKITQLRGKEIWCLTHDSFTYIDGVSSGLIVLRGNSIPSFNGMADLLLLKCIQINLLIYYTLHLMMSTVTSILANREISCNKCIILYITMEYLNQVSISTFKIKC